MPAGIETNQRLLEGRWNLTQMYGLPNWLIITEIFSGPSIVVDELAAGGLDGIRSAIINPRRLSTERREEVCMQCHLETTSFHLPNAIQRYGQGPFAYRSGEPLSAYWLFFDHAPDMGRNDKFEIVNASAYRLRRSKCFLASKGALQCTSCHNPHDVSPRR
jgi:hypothetical protein